METEEQDHTKDQPEDHQNKPEDQQDQSNTNTQVETNTSPTDTLDNTPDDKIDETNETPKTDEEVTSSTDANIDDDTTDANTKESTNATTTSLAQDAMKELFKGVFNDDLANNASAANLAIKAIIDNLPANATLEEYLAAKAAIDDLKKATIENTKHKSDLGNVTGEDGLANKATIDDLRTTVDKLKNELDNAKSEVAVADYIKENLVQTERQKESLQEEMATLQALLMEATQGQEQESQLMKVRKKAKALESENQDLKIQLRMLEGRRNSVRTGGGVAMGSGMPKSPMSSSGNLTAGMDKESLLGNAAVISDRTKNMVRKMKSTVVQSFPANSASPGLPETSQLPGSPGIPEEQLLNALIIPLEEQISALKGKLRETDSLLQTYEKRSAQNLLEMEVVGQWLAGHDREKLESKLVEAAGDGYNEDSSQLYHAILAARIGMLSQELESAMLQVKNLSINLADKSSESMAEKVNSSQLLSSIIDTLGDDSKLQILENFGAQIQKLQNSADSGSSSAGASATKLIVSSEDWLKMKTTLETDRDANKLSEGTGDTSEAMNKMKEDLVAVNKEKEAILKEKIELAKEKEHLVKNCNKYKDDLAKEAAFRKEMEETWNTRGSEYRQHVETLQARLQSNDDKLEKLSVIFLKFKEESRIDLKKLTLDREKIVKELKRLQNENDNLVGKHSSLAEAMNNEVINLPDSTEEMQLLLLQYREDLITAKVGRERAEEKLVSEVSFMKQQLTGEQQARTAIQNQYSSQLQELEGKIRLLEPAHQYLEQERAKRLGLEEKLAQVQSIQNQSKLESTKNLESAKIDKESAEAQIAQLKTKVASLQTDLDNSVAVQNDFVRLSQNLQMELEKIRQSEKEVRWQHEDDVSECNSCKTGLQKTKKKDNCRHCGRIFCHDCLPKKVQSGPSGRMAPVCHVCHTLLVQNSAPYFASEAPSQN